MGIHALKNFVIEATKCYTDKSGKSFSMLDSEKLLFDSSTYFNSVHGWRDTFGRDKSM